MPHVQVIAWWGIAVASQHLHTFLTAAGMTSYLLGRSFSTREWYLKKVDGYPAERKCMIPFLF